VLAGKNARFIFDGTGLWGYIQPAFCSYVADFTEMSGTPGSLKAESLLREVLEQRAGRAVLGVTSSSMSPRLIQGDRIAIEHISPRLLWPGDVVVFRSETVGLVVHRLIWRNHPLGRPTHIFTKGDALDRLDRSARVESVLGRVVSVVSIDGGDGRRRPTTFSDRVRCLRQAAGYGLRRCARRFLKSSAAAASEESQERR